MTILEQWMRAGGFTDEAVSQKVGVSRVQITRIRNGQNRPSRETAMKLEAVTGIPAARFIFGEAA
jgi:transcriptional regulator with XRE-family HTH domain